MKKSFKGTKDLKTMPTKFCCEKYKGFRVKEVGILINENGQSLAFVEFENLVPENIGLAVIEEIEKNKTLTLSFS